ncbi:MAG: prepilin-type N-terminal cleavage/methylation domain-containing protein, partial [Candidatus Moraniibacteriota bacterium]
MTKEKQAQKQKYFSVKAGFSLVEVLIALLILTMGITALVAMLAKNNKEIIATRDQLIATNLAQEGAELVRNNWDNDNTSSY